MNDEVNQAFSDAIDYFSVNIDRLEVDEQSDYDDILILSIGDLKIYGSTRIDHTITETIVSKSLSFEHISTDDPVLFDRFCSLYKKRKEEISRKRVEENERIYQELREGSIKRMRAAMVYEKGLV